MKDNTTPTPTTKRSRAKRPTKRPTPFMDVAMSQPLSPYNQFKTAGSSNVGASTVLVQKFIDHFDSTGDKDFAYQSVLWNPSQQFLSTQTPDSSSFGSSAGHKVKSVTLEALPRFNAGDPALATTVVCFAVPIVSATAGDADGVNKYTCSHQRTTILTPTPNSHWVKVGYWSGVESEELAANSNGNLTLCTMTVLDSDTMAPTTGKLQYRITITVEIALPLVTYANMSIPSADVPTWTTSTAGTTSANPIMSEIVGITKRKF